MIRDTFLKVRKGRLYFLAVAHVNKEDRKPGFLWPLLLGVAGFAAGFVGPMIFVPEANQGPLVGILISGPAGVVLGFVLLVVCTVLGVSARQQWRILIGTALTGILVVLLSVQPSPALRGYVMDLVVESCALPIDTEPQIVNYWSQRIADVTYAAARPGWEQDMRKKLREAPGVVLNVQLLKQISVWERRKPWNRGGVFATAGRDAAEEHSFYDSNGNCSDFPVGHAFRAFERYDLNGRIRPPDEWPPGELEQFIHASRIYAVPAQYDRLAVVPAQAPTPPSTLRAGGL